MYRNKKLLEAVRVLPCQHCGVSDGTAMYNRNQILGDGDDWTKIREAYSYIVI